MTGLRYLALVPFGLLMALAPSSLPGQEMKDVTKGERVKITYESNGTQVMVGLLHDVLDNAFLVAPSERLVVAVPRDQVTEFRVLAGSERRWRGGLMIGAAAGAVAGALSIVMVTETIEGLFGGAELETSPGILTYTAIGALYGGGIGLGVGLLIRRDRWDSVPPPNALPPSVLRNEPRIDFGLYVRLKR